MTYDEARIEVASHDYEIRGRTAVIIAVALMGGDIPNASADAIRAYGKRRWAFLPGVGKTTLGDLSQLVRYWTDEEKMLLERTPP
jgi:hypothetical protein